MNKLAIRETFPPGIVGREIVLAQMCHHYRRVSSAKARVDTNLFKPPKISLSRPLSAEVASIVQRSLSPRSPPKHRKCLKYEHETGEHHIKPSARSQTAESRLRATPEVYHPAVKPTKHQQQFDGQQQETQTSFQNSLAEEDEPKTRDEAVQTAPPGLYRPLEARSVQFLRDITNDALQKRAFTSSALNGIFLDHQFRNTYGLSHELMERELEELRRQLGMFPRRHTDNSTVSDAEALDALDSLVLDPRIKEQVIQSLRLSRTNASEKPTFTYFDRLDFDEEERPIRELTSGKLRETLKAVESFTEGNGSIEEMDEITHDSAHIDHMPLITDGVEATGAGGWNAEIDEEDRDTTSASSSGDEKAADEEEQDESDDDDNIGEVVESMTDSEKENVSDSEDGSSDSDEEVEEVTQRESTSKQMTDENLDNRSQDSFSKLVEKHQTNHNADNNSHISSATADETNESNAFPTSLKLEPLRGDKWRSSLEVVKEESDSTTGQVSDISTASTPTEGESKLGNSEAQSFTDTGTKDAKSSGTYHSAESGTPVDRQEESIHMSKSATPSEQQNTSSSTGGEIVRQMDDLMAEMKSTLDVRAKVSQSKSDNEVGEENSQLVDGQEETESDAGSEVESVQSEVEEDDNSSSQSGTDEEMDSVHTD